MPSKAAMAAKSAAKATAEAAPVPMPTVKRSLLRDHKHNLLVRNLFHLCLRRRASKTAMCADIKRCMDARIGPSWQCIVAADPDIAVRHHTREGVIIVTENNPNKPPVEQLVLVAFRGAADLEPAAPTNRDVQLDHDNFEKKVQLLATKRARIVKTGMTAGKSRECVRQLCISAEEFAGDHQGMLLQLRARLNVLYGPTWHVFASDAALGFAISTEHDNTLYLEAKLMSRHIVMFQCDQEQPKDTTTCMCGILKRPSLKTLPLYGYVLAALFFFIYFYGYGQLCGAPAQPDLPLAAGATGAGSDGEGDDDWDVEAAAAAIPQGTAGPVPAYCVVSERTWGFLAFATFLACYITRMVTRTVTKLKR